MAKYDMKIRKKVSEIVDRTIENLHESRVKGPDYSLQGAGNKTIMKLIYDFESLKLSNPGCDISTKQSRELSKYM